MRFAPLKALQYARRLISTQAGRIHPLTSNYAESITNAIGEYGLALKDRSLKNWWIKKSNARILKLVQEDRVLNEPLFHKEISPEELAMWVSVGGVG